MVTALFTVKVQEVRMRSRRNHRGQALIETSIVIVLFVGITLALVTFGHAFMVVNMITHAARDGARLAATWPTRDGTCGKLDDTVDGQIKTQVGNEIATVTGETFVVNITQSPAQPTAPPCVPATTPTVLVNVAGCVPYVFPIIPLNLGFSCPGGRKGFQVNRTVVFHDEGV